MKSFLKEGHPYEDLMAAGGITFFGGRGLEGKEEDERGGG